MISKQATVDIWEGFELITGIWVTVCWWGIQIFKQFPQCDAHLTGWEFTEVVVQGPFFKDPGVFSKQAEHQANTQHIEAVLGCCRFRVHILLAKQVIQSAN